MSWAVAAFVAVIILVGLLMMRGHTVRATLERARSGRESVNSVEARLLTVTGDLERATLDLKRTVAEMRGEDQIGGVGGE